MDAEGNLLVFHSLMPKGVEHDDIYQLRAAFTGVFHSLMPKGVEHIILPRIEWPSGTVFHSLMPKGVEHPIPDEGGVVVLRGVFHSLMPKGVEHRFTQLRHLHGQCRVSFVDAERR